MFIYVITNTATGKIYIGQHKKDNLKKYLQTKLSDASKHRGGQSRLFNSMRKHPREVWSIEPLFEGIETREELDRLETLLITLYDTRNPEVGYNICKGGEGFTGKHSEESRQRMRDNSARPWAGKKRSPESMAKAADTRRKNGYTYDHLYTPEAKANQVASRKAKGGYKERVGCKNTPETIEKMKLAALVRDLAPYIGLKRSPEAIENLRKGALNRVASESLETRQKRAVACSSTLSLKYGAKRDEAIRLRETGLSYSTIATELGVSYKTARLWSLGQSTYKPKSKFKEKAYAYQVDIPL